MKKRPDSKRRTGIQDSRLKSDLSSHKKVKNPGCEMLANFNNNGTKNAMNLVWSVFSLTIKFWSLKIFHIANIWPGSIRTKFIGRELNYLEATDENHDYPMGIESYLPHVKFVNGRPVSVEIG